MQRPSPLDAPITTVLDIFALPCNATPQAQRIGRKVFGPLGAFESEPTASGVQRWRGSPACRRRGTTADYRGAGAPGQPPSGACRTTAVCASTVSLPPPGTSSAGVSSSGPVYTTSCQEAPNSFGGSVNSIGS